MLLEADYIVIGCGASGMNFVDVMLTEAPRDTTFIYVDKRPLPGGHWVDSYDFVRLHMRSALYGVVSEKLLEDQDPNVRRATGAQIKAYFQRVLEKHLASRRVQFYGQYSYNESTNEIRSIMGGETHKLKWNRKLVDTSFLTSPVPSVNPPSFHVEDTPEIKFCPVNGIAKIHGGNNLLKKFMIIGAGKTSMDAIVFLLNHGVDPDSISWIRPRETWLFYRDDDGKNGIGGVRGFGVENIGIFADSTKTVDDFFLLGERQGIFLRIDEDHMPEMFRGAAISPHEIMLCRKVKNIIKNGRIKSIEKGRIIFENGSMIATDSDTLHVNCSSIGLTTRKPIPIFTSDRITIQMVFAFQPALGAAVLGYIEAHYGEKLDFANEVAIPLAYPKTKFEFFNSIRISYVNLDRWLRYFHSWLNTIRLFSGSKLNPPLWFFQELKLYYQYNWQDRNIFNGTPGHRLFEEVYEREFPNGHPFATTGWEPGTKLKELFSNTSKM